MSQTLKAELYAMFKEAGGEPDKHYREYSTEELRGRLQEMGIDVDLSLEAAAAHVTIEESEGQTIRRGEADPNELPGQRQNSQPSDQPIRIDDQGLEWYQEEVRKPAYPKPRGRRILKYIDTGVRKETAQAGDYVETFEVAGREPGRPAEVKITLPSYQVGIYKDPRFPFKIHVYDERRGFDLYDVQEYFGGAELVPATCRRIYIENNLCYEIRSVIRTIQEEHRQLMLTGRLK